MWTKDGRVCPDDKVEEMVGHLHGRVFQNLMHVIGLDDFNFAGAVQSVSKAVSMFIADVKAEVPHAKPSAGGGKSRAEIEAELKAEAYEKELALKDDARAYVQRAATKQGIAGVPFNSAISMDMLYAVYVEVRDKFTNSEEEGAADAYADLETWAETYRNMGLFPKEDDVINHESLEVAD